MFTQLSRFVLATAGALAGLAVVNLVNWRQTTGYSDTIVIILFVILGASIGFILGGIIGRELTAAFIFVEDYIRRLSGAELLLAIAGLLVGLLVALLVSYPIRLLKPEWIAITGTAALFVLAAYLGIRVALLKRRDFASLFPQLTEGRSRPLNVGSPLLLDTSAIIDGRLGELMDTGVLGGPVRVPGFVLAELQTLSDSADDIRRARGRRGLDLLTTLRKGEGGIDVFDADYADLPDVDSKLVKLASDTGGTILTVDHNLAQVARVQAVPVININDVAAALRPTYLPGEPLHVLVAKEGKEPAQGVGYLEDGTMVVVQDGRDSIGAEVDTVVTSVLQTSGGRMLFARLRGQS